MDSMHPELKQNIFSIMYEDVCRYFHYEPLDFVKPTHNGTVLEFVVDRLKVEDWIPIIVALRYDNSLLAVYIRGQFKNYPFLQNVDTLEMAQYLNRYNGSLWTQFVFSRVTESIAVLLENSKVLTVLELNGLPLFLEYLERLVTALKKNETLKHLSFANSDIGDQGCKMVCEYLENTPNVESINFSGCQLTSISTEYITRFVKQQQINRYCDCWPSSSYEDLLEKGMDGIKQITLNNNPDIKNKGLNFLLITLKYDLWIKALEVQDCGITEELSSKILQTIYCNKSLKHVDLRSNLLSDKTISKVLQILKEKPIFEYQPVFKHDEGSTVTLASIFNDTLSLNSFSSLPFDETKSQEFDLKSNITDLEITEEKLDQIDNDNSNQETLTFISGNTYTVNSFHASPINESVQDEDLQSSSSDFSLGEEILENMDNNSIAGTSTIISNMTEFTVNHYPTPPIYEEDSNSDSISAYLENTEEQLEQSENFSDQFPSTSNLDTKMATEIQIRNYIKKKMQNLVFF